ncbi:MAG: hypothetical protein R3Y60_01050 [bacterium]
MYIYNIVAIVCLICSGLICFFGKRFYDTCIIFLSILITYVSGTLLGQNIVLTIALSFVVAIGSIIFCKIFEYLFMGVISFGIGIAIMLLLTKYGISLESELIIGFGCLIGLIVFSIIFKFKNKIFMLLSSFIGSVGIASVVLYFKKYSDFEAILSDFSKEKFVEFILPQTTFFLIVLSISTLVCIVAQHKISKGNNT